MLMILVVVLLLGSLSIAYADKTLYVAVDGNDNWSGTLAEPNSKHTDGPFASLDKARLSVRAYRKSASTPAPVTVLVRGGTYYLKNTLTFEPEDSGSEQAPITYAAYPGEIPVISGGKLLSGPENNWTVDAKGYWHTNLTEARDGQWAFLSIYVNGSRRYRPRLPKEGCYYVAGNCPVINNKPDSFEFASGTICNDWANLGDVEVLTVHLWAMSRMRIKSVDTASDIVYFTGSTSGDYEFGAFRPGYPYLVENVREALNQPGEWYLDRPSGELTYIPKKGESLRNVEIVAPVLDQIMRINGDPAKGKFIEHLTFKGLTFAHSNWCTPPQGYHFAQSESIMPGGLVAEGALDCKFVDCSVEHTGAYGIQLGAGCKRNVIEDCELTDLGAGGVKIGFWAPKEPEALVTSHNLVRNNLIAHGGRIQPGGTGVVLGSTSFNRVANNDIYDFYYMGISAGFNWDDSISSHDNIIENNHIFGLGQGVLSDMGGIYTLGDSPGTIIRHNLIHDVKSQFYGGWGIYLDAASSNLLVENNIVQNAEAGGFHHNRGYNNRVINNIFALGKEAQLTRSSGRDELSFEIKHNIIYWNNSWLLGGNWDGFNYKLDNNLYWDVSGGPVEFGPYSLEQWRNKGQDHRSIVADPLFLNPTEGDFRLADNSPAYKIGFKQIDMNGIGRYGKILSNPKFAPRAFPDMSICHTIKQDFESVGVGRKWPSVVTSEEDANAIIRVTDKTAVSGSHSLKFIDDGKQKASYSPHLVVSYKCLNGTVRGRFAVKMEQGASFQHEWRDVTLQEHPGPSIGIDPSGNLFANGVQLRSLPMDKWIWFDITCSVGPKAKENYTISVKVEGEKRAKVYHDLKCDRMFRKLTWIGFIANGTGPGVFYLDDVSFDYR